MIVDDITRHRSKPSSNAARPGREALKKERDKRWQKNKGVQEKYSQEPRADSQPMSMDADYLAYPSHTNEQAEETAKRKGCAPSILFTTF